MKKEITKGIEDNIVKIRKNIFKLTKERKRLNNNQTMIIKSRIK